MGLAKTKIGHKFSPDEYLEIERDAEERHGFLDGQIFAMAGGSLSQSRICMNLARTAGNALRGNPCEPLSPNMKVRTSNAGLFSYPDLTIVCGEPVFHDSKTNVLINPKVIFEVLSPTTEKYDRTTKFQRYRMGNETLTDYILVSQERPFVEHFIKQPSGDWVYKSFSDLVEELRIESIDICLDLGEIYDRVVFESGTDEPEQFPDRMEFSDSVL